MKLVHLSSLVPHFETPGGQQKCSSSASDKPQAGFKNTSVDIKVLKRKEYNQLRRKSIQVAYGSHHGSLVGALHEAVSLGSSSTYKILSRQSLKMRLQLPHSQTWCFVFGPLSEAKTTLLPPTHYLFHLTVNEVNTFLTFFPFLEISFLYIHVKNLSSTILKASSCFF